MKAMRAVLVALSTAVDPTTGIVAGIRASYLAFSGEGAAERYEGEEGNVGDEGDASGDGDEAEDSGPVSRFDTLNLAALDDASISALCAPRSTIQVSLSLSPSRMGIPLPRERCFVGRDADVRSTAEALVGASGRALLWGVSG